MQGTSTSSGKSESATFRIDSKALMKQIKKISVPSANINATCFNVVQQLSIYHLCQCTKNGATTIANIVVAINAIRKSRSRVIFIENIISIFPVLLLDQVTQAFLSHAVRIRIYILLISVKGCLYCGFFFTVKNVGQILNSGPDLNEM